MFCFCLRQKNAYESLISDCSSCVCSSDLATVYPGFQWGYAALDDAARWQALVYLHDTQPPPPHETVLRALRAGAMEVHLGARMVDARRAGDRVRLMIAGRPEPAEADFLILGTGFQVALSASPATAPIGPHAATIGRASWRARGGQYG